ncbi:hypothetical protein FB451DRAFT_1387231 [Mycena latifolia]|nr:hypothetical protein FB451DRAFT_1387231 [Mycena latifolia]
MLYKWSIDWSKSVTAPLSLLNMLISMFLTPGKVDPLTQLDRGQGTVQMALLLCAAMCAPILLVGKLHCIWRETKEREGAGVHRIGLCASEHTLKTDMPVEPHRVPVLPPLLARPARLRDNLPISLLVVVTFPRFLSYVDPRSVSRAWWSPVSACKLHQL